MDLQFSQPILAHVAGRDGNPVPLEIRPIRDGLLALHARGLGGYCLEADDWQKASPWLQEAVRRPCPACAEKARIALSRLALQSLRRNATRLTTR